MIKKIGNVIGALIILSIPVGFIWFIYKCTSLIFHALKELDSNVSVAMVAASATLLTSTITVVMTRYYQAKKERDAVHRDKKIELYDKVLVKLMETFQGDGSGSDIELADFLKDYHRKMILWSGPHVIK